MKKLIAVGILAACWAGYITLICFDASGELTLKLIGLIGGLFLAVAYTGWITRRGRPWYGVFLLCIPLYHSWLIGKMFWSWAGEWTKPAVEVA
jgi:hypothetical protein